MKKQYTIPSVGFIVTSSEDILIGSDVLIDIGSLMDEDEEESEE